MLPGQYSGNLMEEDEDEEITDNYDEVNHRPSSHQHRKSIPLSEVLTGAETVFRRQSSSFTSEGGGDGGRSLDAQPFHPATRLRSTTTIGHSSRSILSPRQPLHPLPSSSNLSDEQNEEVEAPPPSLDFIFPFQEDIDIEPRSYHLEIRQSPTSGRACTLASRHRRTLDPLPILKLTIRDGNGRIDEIGQSVFHLMMQVNLVVVESNESEQARLASSNLPSTTIPFSLPSSSSSPLSSLSPSSPSLSTSSSSQQSSTLLQTAAQQQVIPPTRTNPFPLNRILEGKLISSAHVVTDLNGLRGDGINWSQGSTASGNIVQECLSPSFTVFHPKLFPGVSESTPLAKALANQGVQIPIRNQSQTRR